MININENLHIGSGRDRACYLSPQDPNTCIKVSLSTDKQSRREVAYYKFLMSNDFDLSLIAKYYGSVMTDKGKGECFEVIRDYDNSISLTLRQCIKERTLDTEQIFSLLASLKIYLIDNKIVTRDLSPANIMIKRTSVEEIELRIIDGLGNPNINPLTIRVKKLASKAIIKSFNKLIQKTKNEINQSTVSELSV